MAVTDRIITPEGKAKRESNQILMRENKRWDLVLERKALRVTLANGATQADKDANAAAIADTTKEIKALTREIEALWATKGIDDGDTAPTP